MRNRKRFWLIRRGRVFYAWDTETNRRVSLESRNRREAERIIDAKNIAVEQPGLNLALARAYLSGVDPELPRRTSYCSKTRPNPIWLQVHAAIAFYNSGFVLDRDSHSSQGIL